MTMRRIAEAELRAFLLDRLGLRGPFWQPAEEKAAALALAMLQIDSICCTGLRNHELAWAARATTPPGRLYELIYGEGAFRETHYPLFAVRRDWLPLLVTGFADLPAQERAARERFRPLMRRVMRHIRRHGPAGCADFAAERVPGGFNTVKATTRALELLFVDRRLQIGGRTANFHRLFDLTERAAPELVGWRRPARARYERFLVESALAALKIATAEQLARRVAIHYGHWRGASIHGFRALVDRLLPQLAVPVSVAAPAGPAIWWHLPGDEPGWQHAARPADPVLRVVPPLDNLLYSRPRFAALFGFDYKFEAYTPAARRRFYFAMPLVYGDDVAGLVDARRADGVWQIAGLELRRPVPPEALRAGLHRLARLAGAGRVAAATRLTRDLRRTLIGRCDC